MPARDLVLTGVDPRDQARADTASKVWGGGDFTNI